MVSYTLDYEFSSVNFESSKEVTKMVDAMLHNAHTKPPKSSVGMDDQHGDLRIDEVDLKSYDRELVLSDDKEHERRDMLRETHDEFSSFESHSLRLSLSMAGYGAMTFALREPKQNFCKVASNWNGVHNGRNFGVSLQFDPRKGEECLGVGYDDDGTGFNLILQLSKSKLFYEWNGYTDSEIGLKNEFKPKTLFIIERMNVGTRFEMARYWEPKPGF